MYDESASGMPADSGQMSICYEINNYMLNINIYGNFSRMSISTKIRFPAVCQTKEQIRMAGRMPLPALCPFAMK